MYRYHEVGATGASQGTDREVTRVREWREAHGEAGVFRTDDPPAANTLCPLCTRACYTAFLYNIRRQRSLVLPPAFSRGPGDQASNGGDQGQDEAAVADDDDRHEVLHVAA